uniref:Transmembrane protein 184C n=1 Tax=Odontella aurita TaxID=265563 RepID=A0A7S4N6L7_9STRA|mmetsp:Transcript_49289/g.148381  ORF Transcript_49289/g.148381 Transcript_49289/m.148381 type:complete len:457 (+) Transcript_49289:219-1589(+)
MAQGEQSRLTQFQDQSHTGRNVERACFVGVGACLGLVSLVLFIQQQALSRQVRYEQKEIEELKDVIHNEQKGQIEELSQQVQQEQSISSYQLAGTFTLLASLITMFHMTSHLRRFHEPFIQRKILAILMMVPIYGITSFVSLVEPVLRGYVDIMKDFYEAYVIYQFLSFLIAVLGKGSNDRDAIVELLARHADHLKPPMKCLKCCFHRNPSESDKALADAVLLESQILAMQFVLVRPLTSLASFVVDMLDDGNPMPTWDPRYPRFYIVMVQNVSVFCAFTGLLKFYHAVHEDIEWCRPWPKFLCIKGVVFMTFWQGIAVSLLANTAENTSTADGEDFDPREWTAKVQDMLICVEMLFFSLAHFFTFPTDEWEQGYRPTESSTRFGDNIALGDFVSDVKFVVRSSRKSGQYQKYDEEIGDDPVGLTATPKPLESESTSAFGDEDGDLQLTVEDGELS